MEAATPLRKTQVHTIGGRLAIEDLVIDDECAVRVVRDREQAGDDPVRAVVDAIEIGARVLDREQAGAQADFVKAELEKASREVDSTMVERTRALADDFEKKVDEVFGSESGHLTKALERHFSDGSSEAVQHRVKEAVGEFLTVSREDLRKQFSATDGSNPLAEFRSSTVEAISRAEKRQEESLRALYAQMGNLKVELQALRDEKAKIEELAAEREKGTAKGRSYEEEVFAALDEIAGLQGDDTQSVGDTKGATRKTGDVVVGIGGCKGPPSGTLVFEAKDARLSRPEAIRQLDRAMEERGADFAVLVVPTEDEVPANMRTLREYNGDKLIAVWDPENDSAVSLELAYALARARVSMQASESDEIDAAAIGDAAERAVQALGDVRKIKGQLTGAHTSIASAREMVEEMEARVRSYLKQISAEASGQKQLI